MTSQIRIAVISPFLDKQHGTEQCVAAQVERLAREHGYEVHLYCQRVEDIAAVQRFDGHTPANASERIFWHKVSAVPGPHLVRYVWWYLANEWRRRRDSKSMGLRYDAVYSPGINCRDASVIVVHIVFHAFYRQVRNELRLGKLPLRAWPRAIHRRLYYRFIMALERRTYTDPRVTLVAVSRLVARQLEQCFGRRGVRVIHDAIDAAAFNPAARQKRRAQARSLLGYGNQDFVLLLVGNDWKKKGLDCLLAAVRACPELPLKILVVGQDDPAPYHTAIERLPGRIRFAGLSRDVLQFYAAADAYVGPSLEDAFGLPPAEAMACGLPVIVSRFAGVSELIHDGEDGLILRDPKDPRELSAMIRRLYAEARWREQLGSNAAKTAQQFGWERNVRETHALLKSLLDGRGG